MKRLLITVALLVAILLLAIVLAAPGCARGDAVAHDPGTTTREATPGAATVTADRAAPSGEAALYKADPGPHKIGRRPTLVLHDAARDKDLQLRVTWPADATGPCPTLVWSHGATGSKDGYAPLVEHWASHGYVVLQATHSDSLKLGRKGKRELFADWASRPKDVAFMLDAIDSLEREIPELRGRIDRERIGVGGHSYGAHTSQLVAGATTRQGLLGRRRQSHADPRPRAFLLISPQGKGQLLDEKSWETCTRPMMTITGTRDESPRTDRPWTWRLDPFRYAPPGGKFLVVIQEAYHGFGGIAGRARYPSSGPANADHVSWVRSMGLAFWDAYVLEDAAARDYLRSGSLEAASQGDAKITAKEDDSGDDTAD